jgi:hypothetical protein
MMFLPHRNRAYGPSRLVASFIFVYKWCLYLTGNASELPKPLTGIALLFSLNLYDVRTSQKTYLVLLFYM